MFGHLFGQARLSAVQAVSYSYRDVCIEGCLSPPSSVNYHWSKELQMAYVNSRHVSLPAAADLINSAYQKCFALLTNRKPDEASMSSGHKHGKMFAIYLLNFTCPKASYDLLAAPDAMVAE
ncbi:unnamed protein product, partial [Chrysoparadoxa australica]